MNRFPFSHRPLLLLLFLVTAGATLWGESLVLDLETCLRMALENNPDLRISSLDLSTARRNSRNTWNVLLPGISAGAGVSDSSSPLTGGEDSSVSINGSLNMSLSLNAGLASEVRGIRLAFEQEQINYEQAGRELISAVESEFYYLITSESNLDMIRADWELTRKSYEQAKSNYENGIASELSVLQARVSASNQEPVYKQAAAAHEARMNNFLITIGLPPGTEIRLEGSLAAEIRDLDSEELITRYLPDRLDIRTLINELEILKEKKKQLSLSSRTPTIGLSAGWKSSRKEGADWADSLTLGVDVRMPLDDLIYGSSTSLDLGDYDDQIRQREISLGKAYAEAETEILNLINQLNTAADNIRISALNVDLAEESFALTGESFSRGLSQPLEVDSAQQDLFSARQQYLSSQYDYLQGLIELRDALGLEDLDDLN